MFNCEHLSQERRLLQGNGVGTAQLLLHACSVSHLCITQSNDDVADNEFA